MKKGEIWRTMLPPATGHAQSGTRPCLIVQDDAYAAAAPTVLIVPFTSAMHTTRYPGTLVVQPSATNGLTVPSVALVFQLHVVDRRMCQARLGELDPQTVDQILALFDRLTGR